MICPTSIRKIGGELIIIAWPDGSTREYSARELRLFCRCAACKDEFTGERIITDQDVPTDIKINKSELVGNYALQFEFSDGHATGIYPFDQLHKKSKN